MRPGKVATIRVNPKDCMGAIDVLTVAGVNINGASFASVVSLAFSSLLQTMRDQGIIPDRDGFEYSTMMAPYEGEGRPRNDARKRAVSDAIHHTGSKLKINGISTPSSELAFVPIAETLPAPTQGTSIELRQAQSRLTELLQKRDLADTVGSGVIWQTSDEQEFQECYRVVYPEG